jgi:hypothetical protein
VARPPVRLCRLTRPAEERCYTPVRFSWLTTTPPRANNRAVFCESLTKSFVLVG